MNGFPEALSPNLRTFKLDLVAAKLAKIVEEKDGTERFDCEDEDGRSLDFHRLRVSFVRSLVAASVHPKVAQALARYAKIETTMAVYTDLHSLDLRGRGWLCERGRQRAHARSRNAIAALPR